MTQAYLASDLGLSRPTYMQIERGGWELTIREAKKLAGIFALSLEDFWAGREAKHTVKLTKPSVRKTDALKIRVTEKNLDRFKQVLLYVLNKVGGKPNVGETVLHKLLYFIDFDYYEKVEENLTGNIDHFPMISRSFRTLFPLSRLGTGSILPSLPRMKWCVLLKRDCFVDI